MTEHWLAIVGASVSMFGVIGIGASTRLLGWLSEEADQSLLKLIIRVLLPCLILDSVVGNPALQQASNVILPPLVGYGTMAAGLIVASIFARLGHAVTGLADARERRTFAFAVGIYNYGYLAIPLITLLFDRATLGVLFVHNVGAEMAFWTAGVLVLRGELGRRWWLQVLNPPSVTILFALALNFSHLGDYLPASLGPFFATGVQWLGQSAIPLSLILIGATIADELRPNGNLRSHFDMGKAMAWACLLRLGVLPLLFLLGAMLVPGTDALKRVIAVEAAMPSAVFPIILARLYGGSPGIALRGAPATSVGRLLTIPPWIATGLEVLGLTRERGGNSRR